ncbi:MAG: type II secretion system GspH family protein [Dehalococcoidia bacterium]|nr:type II secretion system GspH family protein [Dehalococcoidia bacterium]
MSGERGFTLVELLVGTAITAVIVSFLGFAVFQTFQVEEYGSAQITARNELQNVRVWMHGDAIEARNATGGSELVLILPNSTKIVYLRDGTSLIRRTNETVNVVARNITDLAFSVSGRLITVKIASTPQGRSGATAEATYYFTMRPTP